MLEKGEEALESTIKSLKQINCDNEDVLKEFA